MGQSASQARVFYQEVVENGIVWAIKDEKGFPAPVGGGDIRSMPFWSSVNRAKKIIDNVPAYKDFEPVELELNVFKERWLPGLEKDKYNVGVNWSGSSAKGYDLSPSEVLKNLKYYEQK